MKIYYFNIYWFGQLIDGLNKKKIRRLVNHYETLMDINRYHYIMDKSPKRFNY